MAGFKRFPNGTVQFVIKRAGLLDKPIYLTYPAEQEVQARDYVKKVEALLDRGIVPGELKAPSRVLTIDGLVTLYMREASPKPKDVQQLTAVSGHQRVEVGRHGGGQGGVGDLPGHAHSP